MDPFEWFLSYYGAIATAISFVFTACTAYISYWRAPLQITLTTDINTKKSCLTLRNVSLKPVFVDKMEWYKTNRIRINLYNGSSSNSSIRLNSGEEKQVFFEEIALKTVVDKLFEDCCVSNFIRNDPSYRIGVRLRFITSCGVLSTKWFKISHKDGYWTFRNMGGRIDSSISLKRDVVNYNVVSLLAMIPFMLCTGFFLMVFLENEANCDLRWVGVMVILSIELWTTLYSRLGIINTKRVMMASILTATCIMIVLIPFSIFTVGSGIIVFLVIWMINWVWIGIQSGWNLS